MTKRRRAPFVTLTETLAAQRPDVDPAAITAGRVLVDGRVLDNPAARVRSDAAVRILPERRLRGDIKLSFALDSFTLKVAGRVAVDVGASAGGFTTALLARGAARVFAVDVGVGQLSGALRADVRVANLEKHNLADLDGTLVPEAVDILTVDLSYLSLVDALPQLRCLRFAPGADLVALVKPTFELRRPRLAATDADLAEAVRLVTGALPVNGWAFVSECRAPATGQRGAREAFLHARR